MSKDIQSLIYLTRYTILHVFPEESNALSVMVAVPFFNATNLIVPHPAEGLYDIVGDITLGAEDVHDIVVLQSE